MKFLDETLIAFGETALGRCRFTIVFGETALSRCACIEFTIAFGEAGVFVLNSPLHLVRVL